MLSARLLNWVVGLLDVALLLLRLDVSSSVSADEWLCDEAPLPPTKRHLIMIDHNCARTKIHVACL